MRTLRFVGLLALLGTGACYREYTPYSAAPFEPGPVTISGPPGGEMDQGYGYEAPGQPGYPAGYPEGYAQGTENAAAADQPTPEPSADPQDPGYVMGTVTDSEIEQALAPHGSWVIVEDYGRVWRPDTTVVGVNFTPYESCGSWTYTDYGWTFACEWDWGWLPFHYGQWDWLDDGWCWVPGYTWSPGWVDWRYGGGYVGWRPQRPSRDRVRDHRDHGGKGGKIVRDHRRPRDSDWRFVGERDFGKRNLRAHTHTNLAEGLRVTADVARPPVRATGVTVSAANVMRGRLAGRLVQDPTRGSRGHQPARSHTYQGPSRTGSTYTPPSRTYQPPYTPPSRGTYNPPSRGTYNPPSGGTYNPPSRGTYNPPSRGTYNPPSRGTYNPPSRGTYNPPSRGTYNPPSRGTYNPPSRSTYTPPSRSTYSPPSRSTYSPPSRSSTSSPSRSSSSSSYSSPSRSSSSSSSSRSNSSSSSSSRSSSSSSGGSRRR